MGCFSIVLFSVIVTFATTLNTVCLPFFFFFNPNNEARRNYNNFSQTLSKLIHLPSLEIQSRIYWQKSLNTETDANIWQPFADHPVHDTFLDSQLHRASWCTSLSPDDAGRLQPVVFDDDRVWQQRSE